MPETPEGQLQLALLKRDVEALAKEVEALRGDMKALVEAWNTATGVVKFVKWVAGLATAAGVVLAFFKHPFS